MLSLESIKCFIDLNISLHSEGVGCMAQGSTFVFLPFASQPHRLDNDRYVQR